MQLPSQITTYKMTAVGFSTNLITEESNIIIVRGGGSRPVWNQMMNAVQEFFPDEAEAWGITQDTDTLNPARPDVPKGAKTGVTSVVGPDNGERLGRFVLVIDGLALNYVSASISADGGLRL